MKNFLAIYVGTPESRKATGWDDLPEDKRRAKEREGLHAWTKWVQDHHDSIAQMGAPLGKTKRVSSRGTEDVRNNLAGFTVVKAESYADAARMFENHPHFAIFPGEAVEIMECLPIPGMDA